LRHGRPGTLSAGVGAAMRRRAAPSADGRTVALATAGACAVGLLAVWVVAMHTGVGRARDDAMLHGFVGVARERVYSQITDYAIAVDPVPYAVVGLLCIGVAVVRRRYVRAAAVAVVLVGTGVTTQALKHLVQTQRYTGWLGFNQIEGLTWPSGHGTAAMTIALCAVMVAAPAWRAPVALLGCAFAVGLAYATLALTWHYPSDLFGGFLVAGLWVASALVVVARFDTAEAEPPPLGLPIAVGASGSLLAAALVGIASEPVRLGATDRATVVIGALALALLALALAVATMLALSEGSARASALEPRAGRRRVPSRA
jgi:membrane-associated phospholipid phosphatase